MFGNDRNGSDAFPCLKAPIVLVHGLLGYDRVRLGGYTLASYFSNIPECLRRAGNHVYVPRLSPTAGVADRAEQLRDYVLRELHDQPFHLIAHSMGGLDSRFLISRLGMAARVLTLTTIGTPHRGTTFADWGIRRFERFLRPVMDLFDFPCQAFYDLTRDRCARFHDEVRDAPQVRYFSISGRINGSWHCPEWHIPHDVVFQAEGPNDGVVSIWSSRYGEAHEVWEGNHLNLVNWPSGWELAVGLWRERTPQYVGLIHRLASHGF